MDFGFSPEQELQRQVLRETLARVCPPEYARRCDEEKRPPREAFEALAQAGWLGLGLPEEFGGQGGDQVDIAILLEEVGRAMVDLALWIFRAMIYGGQAVLDSGSPEQRAYFLPRVARGQLSTAFALTEPDSGSDAAALGTTAVREGEEYVLNGRKMFCSGFTVSEFVLVAARTDPEAPKHAGISLFLVDTKSAGLTHQIIDVLGHRSVATTALFLDGVRTPAGSRLGAPGEGWKLLGRYLEWERLCLSAARTGGAVAALDEALAWAKQRQQFGRPIGKFQAVSHKLADMAVQVDLARLLVYRYAWMLSQGTAGHKEAAILKLFAAEAYKEVADLGLQVMGGYGYSMESAMQRHFRDARLGTIGGGTSEIQKNIIARELGL
ncbi:MAG TPA: acyl-CoA dehydrogenase family protein [Candidatus Acidoferrales bacterium]|nr:acyl-CoA dehydrogenase family protein [Candidatus Acidoferrales bacterium]